MASPFLLFMLLMISALLLRVDAVDFLQNIFARANSNAAAATEEEHPSMSSSINSWLRGKAPSVPQRSPVKSVPRPAPVRTPTRPVTNTFVAPSQFQIALGFLGIPPEDQLFFTNAAARWQSIVIGDLPDVAIGSGVLSPGGCLFPDTIDDLHICATYGTIDGPGRILGYSSPSYTRGPTGLTVAGEMRFDSDDIATLKTGNLAAVVLHEMGHVLGIGSLWGLHGLTTSNGQPGNCPYRGPKANAEYKAISGCPAVPPETDGAGGTACGHWDEECLQNELMTGYLNPTGTVKNPLSRITIASLADLGYEVRYTSADSYTKKDLNPSCVCSKGGRGRGRQLQWSNATGPIEAIHRQRRQLSAEAHAEAVQFGKNILAQTKLPTTVRSSSSGKSEDFVFVGNREVVVYVEEEGSFFDVVVTM
jgi:Leishmanolysin